MRHCPIHFEPRPKGHLHRAANNQLRARALSRSVFRSARNDRTSVDCGETEERRQLRPVVALLREIPPALQSCWALLNFGVGCNANQKDLCSGSMSDKL